MEAAGSNGIDKTFPDLLKNTPSNIARLEDVIEQSKGRQKYLAQTRSPSDGGDVRWYFCKVPLAENDSAASVPRLEIVGKSEYFRFGMRDSLAVEASFLQREEELLSIWWKEYAECSKGPREGPSSNKNLNKQQSVSSVRGSQSSKFYDMEEEKVGVPVKGGLYEVDLAKRHCFPVYWNGENRRVLRGHWFARKGGLDWLPLREDVAEQLEVAYNNQVWHRRMFQPSGLFAARVELQGSTPGLHAHFTGEDDTWEAWLNVDASGFSSLINFRGNGIKLRRGYSPSNSLKPTQDDMRQQKEEEMDDYCSQVPVRHLVFMVHGIGQRLEKSNLVDDVGTFRHITAGLAEHHLTSHQRGTQRVLFIPCQWRKGLKLSGESAVEKITLDGVRGFRVMLSATVHDVLYYMSLIYCQEIIDSVSNQLNRLYLKFLKRNPGYDGKVSIYGHSLGSVLSYDILCHQENLSSPFPMDWMYKEHAEPVVLHSGSNNHSSMSNRLSNREDINYSVIDDTVSMVSPSSNKVSVQPTLLFQRGECSLDSPTVLDPAISNMPTVVVEADPEKQSSVGDVCEDLCDTNDIISQRRDVLDESVNMNFNVPVDGLGEITEKFCEDTSNKDKVIKMLREEIESLQVNLANLESHRDCKDTIERLYHDQSISDKLLHEQDAPPKSYTPYIKYTKLEFTVDTFFAVGSPLGVFLALRNIRIGIGKGKDYWEEENIREEMPACRKIFNIFHPFDPVAYRIEPLVGKEYIDKRPVLIPYHKGGRRLHIGFQEFTEDVGARSQAIMDNLNSVRVRVLTVCQSRNVDRMEEGDNYQEKEERSYGSLMMERLTGNEGGRIDHMLQDKTFKHPYLQALGAHTNYWRDYDTALFILKHLYREIPEDPNLLVDSSAGNSKGESDSAGWCDPRDNVDEELPLTFSDKAVVRNFSRKAKKILEKF
ncbi:Phospholipase SGR2 [Quillaja saponaria]|uniref:Phospholipase SGR2 n=1 Tax=Quillaja saponaria TaxID=32244 RepID=A0AAD7LR32_QUISA|nr:Phospholipase SGR2 [Quillaja saponaria]